MKNTLSRHKCWLVQAGVFKDNIQEITGRNSIIDLNYMGSSEFEWGALPSSTERMLINIDFYDTFEFPEYKNPDGESLIVYAPKMFIDHIVSIVDELAQGKNYHLKEYCSLNRYLNGEQTYEYADFWWDIENDFYIFFGEEKKELVLQAQKAMRERSIGDIEIGDWDKLSEYYSIVNNDLSVAARAFLKPKKSRAARRLVKALNYRINQMSNTSDN